MPQIFKINVGGVEYKVQEVGYKTIKEDWNEYQLDDGSKVRVKTGVQKIVRVLDASNKPAFTADGDPHVVVKHNTQVVSSV